MKTIALVGTPNVGKSTLFNRLTKSHSAITSDVEGTTRDTKRSIASFGEHSAILIDTGGLESRDEMFEVVRRKSLESAKSADLVLFLVDGQMMPSIEERKLFYEIQSSNSNIALVLNKIDNNKLKEQRFEYMSFGAKNLFTISCAHKSGLGELEEWIEEQIKDSGVTDEPLNETDLDNIINVAIIGRPNVGKSALLNALVGFERSVVSSIAGTTIDPVDEMISVGDQQIRFVDTAGLRRRSRIVGIERFAFDRTEKMLEGADVALVVLDASEEIRELDEKIAGLVDKHKLATIIVLNKYDIKGGDYQDLEKEVRRRFRFLEYAPLISVSATSKKRVHKLKDLIGEVYDRFSSRISTARLNEIILDATSKHPIPSDKGKVVKIYYSTQFDTKPPRIALVSNRPKAIHFSYLRYLVNRIRESVDLMGSPIVLIPRAKKDEDAWQKN